MRKNIAAGNWKMNTSLDEGLALTQAIVDGVKPSETEVILCAPATHLKSVVDILAETPNVFGAAQNVYGEPKGAYTGETSASMIQSVGATHVVIGHSERRQHFGETHEVLAKKVDISLSTGLKPIFCCGEPLSIREAGTHVEYVAQQLKESLFHLSAADFSTLVIAYEPIWAIGTGVTASPAQAQDMHQSIRGLLTTQYGEDVANATSILYGGSVKPANAKEIFSCPDVDGGLVGGASLNADSFLAIIDSF